MKTVLFLLLLSPLIGWAQTTKISPADLRRKQSYLIMRDGSVVRGQILRQDSSLITVQKRNRELTFVEADQLVRIVAVRPDVPDQPDDEVRFRRPGSQKVFVLKDGTQVEGQFVRRDSTMITVRKRDGQLTYFEPELLVRTDSGRVEVLSDDGRTFPNRFPPYLLTGLTAFNPEKGRFYYRNTWVLLNEFQYGITRFWSVGARFVTPFPYILLADDYYGAGRYGGNLSQLSTKFSAVLDPEFRLSLNGSFQSDPNSHRSIGGRLTLQALATIGSSQRNVTVGFGIVVPRRQISYAYLPFPPYNTVLSNPSPSFLSVGIMQKVGPGLTLLSDNSINLGQQPYYNDTGNGRASVSAALRIDRRRHAFDLGVYALVYEKPFLWHGDRRTRFLPYVGCNLLIGRD